MSTIHTCCEMGGLAEKNRRSARYMLRVLALCLCFTGLADEPHLPQLTRKRRARSRTTVQCSAAGFVARNAHLCRGAILVENSISTYLLFFRGLFGLPQIFYVSSVWEKYCYSSLYYPLWMSSPHYPPCWYESHAWHPGIALDTPTSRSAAGLWRHSKVLAWLYLNS